MDRSRTMYVDRDRYHVGWMACQRLTHKIVPYPAPNSSLQPGAKNIVTKPSRVGSRLIGAAEWFGLAYLS